MADGAISFDKVEVKFNLVKLVNHKVFKSFKDANHLIEEFMLLANKKWQNSLVNKRKLSFIEFMMNQKINFCNASCYCQVWT
jgi:exoribonuclease R